MQANISSLRSLLIYPKTSNYGEMITLVDAGINKPNYCQRIRGWFVSSQQGNHTFYTSCDDICQLYLSDDIDPLNAHLIISQSMWTTHNNWYSYPSLQTSQPIPLKKNYSYYIELVMLNTGTPDGLSMAVKMPNNIMKAPISNDLLGNIKVCSSGSCNSTNIEKCFYVNSSYAVCTCQNGYYPINDQCFDINECLFLCNFANSICVNFDGGYNCSCKTFWQLASNGLSCIDINECSVGTHNCFGEKISCINQIGGYNCTCDNDCWILKPNLQDQRCEEKNTTDAKCTPKLTVNVLGSINRELLELKLEIIYSNYTLVPAHDLTIEYFMPNYISQFSKFVPLGFSWIKDFKYILNGTFNLTSSISYILNVLIHYDKFPNKELTIEIPIKVTFQNFGGKKWNIIKIYRSSVKFQTEKNLIINKDSSALSDSYGRGVYYDQINRHIYICMNQHVSSSRSACYYSKNYGESWIALDVQLGSILGRHSITNKLYAIHRNQKLYLTFNEYYKNWFALTNDDFLNNVSKNIKLDAVKNLEGDEDQIFILDSKEWKANADGLFFRNTSSDSWTKRAKWLK
ncbi:uncharacterized protein LOC105847419 isoform X2 [Hydra vulgaris]|nr:uncharacterized protein LOC105847419 isoform X2 [Hydra vulgaris]